MCAGPVAEGAVGAGAGTMCYSCKGGIGTSSRLVRIESAEFTLGILVQSNFGSLRDLLVMGVPVRPQRVETASVDKSDVFVPGKV